MCKIPSLLKELNPLWLKQQLNVSSLPLPFSSKVSRGSDKLLLAFPPNHQSTNGIGRYEKIDVLYQITEDLSETLAVLRLLTETYHSCSTRLSLVCHNSDCLFWPSKSGYPKYILDHDYLGIAGDQDISWIVTGGLYQGGATMEARWAVTRERVISVVVTVNLLLVTAFPKRFAYFLLCWHSCAMRKHFVFVSTYESYQVFTLLKDKNIFCYILQFMIHVMPGS